MKIYIKWILIVGLNSLLGFIIGGNPNEPWFQIGIILGIFSWLIAYIILDKYLIKTGRLQESRRLSLSASIRIPLQFTVFPDVYAGIAAIWLAELLGIDSLNSQIISAYFTIVFTGFFLSLVCLIIYVFLCSLRDIQLVRKNA